MKDSPESIPEEIVSAWRTIEEWVWEHLDVGSAKLTRLTLIGHEVFMELLDRRGNATKTITLSVTRRPSESSSSSIEGSWSLPRVGDLGFVTNADRTAAGLDVRGITNEIIDPSESHPWDREPVEISISSKSGWYG
jgi:hypothetical protein